MPHVLDWFDKPCAGCIALIRHGARTWCSGLCEVLLCLGEYLDRRRGWRQSAAVLAHVGAVLVVVHCVVVRFGSPSLMIAGVSHSLAAC